MNALKRVEKYLAILLLMSITSCASIVKGTNEKFRIMTEPSESKIIIESSDGLWKETKNAPCTFQILSYKDYNIRIEKDGYKTKDIALTKRVSVWIAGNLLFGWILGAAIDIIGGAMWEHDTSVKITLDSAISSLPTNMHVVFIEGNRYSNIDVQLVWEKNN